MREMTRVLWRVAKARFHSSSSRWWPMQKPPPWIVKRVGRVGGALGGRKTLRGLVTVGEQKRGGWGKGEKGGESTGWEDQAGKRRS